MTTECRINWLSCLENICGGVDKSIFSLRYNYHLHQVYILELNINGEVARENRRQRTGVNPKINEIGDGTRNRRKMMVAIPEVIAVQE